MSGSIEDKAETIRMVAEVHDNWWLIATKDKGTPVGIGTWLPPAWADGVMAAKVAPGRAREIMAFFRGVTLDLPFYSVRVASNNRLLTVGSWQPPDGIAGIQVDRIMPDQARELLDELKARSEGPSLVGTIEGRG